MIMQQQQTTEELCNLLIQSIEAKDEKTTLKVLEHEDEAIIKEILTRVPVHHVRKLVIELRNILSSKLTVNHLRWLQQLIILKFTVISSMADGRSILLPMISLLDDRSSSAYYTKMQALRGKINLLKQLKEFRRTDVNEVVIRVPIERDQAPRMEVDEESETDSEEDFEPEEEEAGIKSKRTSDDGSETQSDGGGAEFNDDEDKDDEEDGESESDEDV